jgi:bis(5'-nucleosyl)-tetraphosphatase (symmetrical)
LAIYAIGDVQGCFDELRVLLAGVHFRPHHDQLWLAGDLVNRGPRSLDVLRFVSDLGDRAIAVLGNHDLHLLAVAAGKRRLRRKDTIADVLEAPDRDQLLTWLRTRPLLHHDPDLGFTMIHAGLPPQWDLSTAKQCAREVESALRSPDYPIFLDQMFGDQPDQWSSRLAGVARLRFIINCLTRMRYCDRNGVLDLSENGPPGTQKPSLMPWFEVPSRCSRGERIIFGHWATLQLHQALDTRHQVYHLETGCTWGGHLTALELDSLRYISVSCAGIASPE